MEATQHGLHTSSVHFVGTAFFGVALQLGDKEAEGGSVSYTKMCSWSPRMSAPPAVGPLPLHLPLKS